MSAAEKRQERTRGATRRVLGIDFFTGGLDAAIDRAMLGGLVLAPSGPGLATDLVREQAYRDAVADADLVLVDSSALVLFWSLFSGERLNRISGLMFLRAFLRQQALREPGAVFWVMPSDEEARRNIAWLEAQGFRSSPGDYYVAPYYGAGAVADEALLALIESRRPRVVILAIGGGVQERLGHFLKQRLPHRPCILCLGAAIAFLSGGQARIPAWADTIMLAWLVRVLHSPRRFAGRYLKAWRLLPLLWSNRERMPPLKG
jgi:UDP-N-acetyl-D-mannosaminuronic acid transferase (WecB/TagA/CpsF family)